MPICDYATVDQLPCKGKNFQPITFRRKTQSPPDGDKFRSRSPLTLSISLSRACPPARFYFFWAVGEKSAIPRLKWEEVTDSPRPSALCLSLFSTDVCLFVHKYIELSVGVRLLARTNTTSSAKPSVSRTQPDNSLVGWAHHPCLQLLPVNNKLAEDTHGSKCLQF